MSSNRSHLHHQLNHQLTTLIVLGLAQLLNHALVITDRGCDKDAFQLYFWELSCLRKQLTDKDTYIVRFLRHLRRGLRRDI